jgi:hypothetical protein
VTEINRPFGSAAGIPGPPEPPYQSPSAGGEPGYDGSTAARHRGPSRRGRLWWLIVIPFGIVAVVLAHRSSTTSASRVDTLMVGDCFLAPSSDVFESSKIDLVDCAKPHNHEVYAVGTTRVTISSAVHAENNPEIVRVCRTDVSPAVLAALARTADVTPGVIANRDKAGRLVCTADTGTRTGSVLAAIGVS